jgi:cytochrome c biogenesis protein CcmG, thiol:disulfide interchange protein DsbE
MLINKFITHHAVVLALLLVSPVYAMEPGQLAPEFSLPGSVGDITLSDFKGQIVYLDFWASWCGPCKKSFPWMNAMQSKFGPSGFKIIAVNLDADTEDGKRFLKTVPANFDIAFDARGVTPRQYQVKGMPSSILIGRDGKIVLQHAGFNDGAGEKMELAIAFLITGNAGK